MALAQGEGQEEKNSETKQALFKMDLKHKRWKKIEI